MKNLTESEKQVFEAYVEKENQRIASLPLRNTRRFFIDDTPPANFIEDYQWLKQMVLDSFLLLKPEQRPDGEFLHDVLSMFDIFIDELKIDAETPQPEKQHPPAYDLQNFEPFKQVVKELSKATIEATTLKLILGDYLQNEKFFTELKVSIKLFKDGIIDENRTATNYIDLIKTKHTNSPVKDEFLKMLLQNGVYLVLVDSIAADFMKGWITADEAQFKFIETIKDHWKFNTEKTNIEFQPMKEAV